MWSKCENNVKVCNRIIFIFISHDFHTIFTFWGPKAATGRARPEPLAAASEPWPGCRAPKCENNIKVIWNKYENHVISNFHMILISISYYFHLHFHIFLGSGPRSWWRQSSHLLQYSGSDFPGACCFPGRRSAAGKRHWAHPAHQNRKNMDASKCINNYVNLYSIDSQSCKINETSFKIIWKQWNIFQNWMKYCEIL